VRLTHAAAAFATVTAGACSTGNQETAPSATASDVPSAARHAAPFAAPSTASAMPHGPWARLAVGDNIACVADASGALVCSGPGPQPTYPRGLLAPKGAALAVSHEAVCVGPSGGAVRCLYFDGSASFKTDLASARALRIVHHGVCALDDAGVSCAFGRLDASDPPVRIEGIAAPTAFDARSSILCAIDAGVVACASTYVPRPPFGVDEGLKPPILAKPIRGTQGAVEVAVGGIPCARTEAGTVLCWTDNVAKAVPGLPKATQVVAGSGHAFVIDQGHACALDEVGAVRCWGNNNDAQLGAAPDRCPVVDLHLPKTGPDHRCDEPLLVDGLPPIAELAAGYAFTCARTTQGEIYCWGRGGPQREGVSGLDPELRRLEL